MEKEFLVKTVAVKYICDSCHNGELIATGENNWMFNPPQFTHKCNKCGSKVILSDRYPIIKYRNID
ncbi:hypothetical protein NSA50_17930 [Clostridium sp. DSM 100503]|uniref:hypothetical protein n=1 Tax=Clostridium sp. DSM 100503 TaxID=2963282 RepID=UPI002149D784|nr:hypothetical protein [Clostridium sp. DSM 100503]MCR1952884.1 hypothetical protein [Clostridium sp. DSM 100503]